MVVSVLVIGTLAGCSNSGKTNPTPTTPPKVETPSPTPETTPEPTPEVTPEVPEGTEDIPDVAENENMPAYIEVRGEITAVEEQDGITRISVVNKETEESTEAVFIVTGDTYKLDDTGFVVGDNLKGYYPSDSVMIMIYPPQYTLTAVAKVQEGVFTKADRFDSNLLSKDQELKLNLAEGIEVINGDLENLTDRDLLVVYDVTTKSIPAQTTPLKIVVLK